MEPSVMISSREHLLMELKVKVPNLTQYKRRLSKF